MFSKIPNQYHWDYSQISTEEVRQRVKNRTIQIRALDKQIKANFITLGNALAWVKEHLPYGQFGEWLKAEFDLSHDTASRLISVAKKCEQIPQIADFGMSVAYLLSAPSTPSEAIEAVIVDYEQSGEKPTISKVKSTIEKHKNKPAPKQLPANVPTVSSPDVGLRRMCSTFLDQVNEYYPKATIDTVCDVLHELAAVRG